MGVIVKAVERMDFDDGQDRLAEHADGQFPADNQPLNQRGRVEGERFPQGDGELFPGRGGAGADAGTLRVRLDEERQRQRDFLRAPHELPLRRGHAGPAETFLGLLLVEGDAADRGVLAGEGDAARREQFLDLAILAEGAVQGEEGEIDPGGQRHGAFVHGDLDHVVAAFAERLGHGRAGPERDLALGGKSAHEDRDALRLVAHLVLLPEHDDLGMQVDLPRFAGAVLDERDELQDVLRGRPAVVDDEIAVHFGNAGRADGKIFQAQLVDELARRDRSRILEDAPGASARPAASPSVCPSRPSASR